MRSPVRLPPHEGNPVHAVDHPVGRELRARRRGRGGVDVDVRDRLGVDRAGRDAARPARNVGDAGPAFEQRELPATVGRVHLGQADVTGAAVVAREDHERVLGQAILLERREDPADAAVEGPDHRRVHAQPVELDVRERLVVRPQGLERRVRRPVGEVEEEGPVAVRGDQLDRLVGPIVGQVARRLEGLAVVEALGEAAVPLEEGVDRVEVLSGVDDVGMVLTPATPPPAVVTLFHPRSSARMTTMLGGRLAIGWVGCAGPGCHSTGRFDATGLRMRASMPGPWISKGLRKSQPSPARTDRMPTAMPRPFSHPTASPLCRLSAPLLCGARSRR